MKRLFKHLAKTSLPQNCKILKKSLKKKKKKQLGKVFRENPFSTQLPCGSDGKESSCNAGDMGSIPGLGDSLEKEMATHSSILAWKIPWTEESGRLQLMGLHRVSHD